VYKRQFIGGAQWHPFDHQRGYHPDPYWGGIFDCFRQPKYAYYMFRSQVSPKVSHPICETGPMTYIANEISPFSDSDVVVFSNCDSVRLIAYEKDTIVQPVIHQKNGIPNAPVIFKNVYKFWDMREYTYVQKNWQKVSFVAEGIIDGKVVCSFKRMPSRRSTKLRLTLDHEGQSLVADGSDFAVVIAEVTDDSGNVRRLAKENVVFSVEGEGTIIGDASIGANPRAVEFGSAPVLIRATNKAGKIKVKAHVQYEGVYSPTTAELEFESIPAEKPFCYIQQAQNKVIQNKKSEIKIKQELSEEEKRKVLNEVELQQTEFGEKHLK
jgi:beta-galactosidase